jgi:CheY-like chemotaxis protein
MPHAKTKNAADAPGAALASNATGCDRRALIVNTDPASTSLCQQTLERMGFAVERADGGVAALVAARRHAPDLIVMDLQLPDASAGETIGWLRANPSLRSVPIVVLGASDGSRLPLKDASPLAALGKPLSSAAIERVVRGFCG